METNLLDILWIIVASCLVFFMQAGFAMVESGLTRSKNSINVAIKNLTDLGVSTLFFWVVGFGLMFGQSYTGYFGSDGYIFRSESTWSAAFFLFQVMFCSTSATIVSGAIAERVKYGSYIVATIFLSAFVYPVFGHWVWGGALNGEVTGWLGKIGFIDFAGSTVVHSLGGWVALAFLLIIGPRAGRYKKDGKAENISGSNIPMVVLGVLILWFGWFGFNGGSTLSMDESVAGIILKTTLSASAAMAATLAVGWPILKKPDVTLVMNGALAGLVAITAPVHAVTEIHSVIIGAVGGIVMLFTSMLLTKIKIDDAVDAIPVHLAAGIWGTVAVGLFGDPVILGTGLGRSSQIIAQLIGIGACGIWAFGTAFIFLNIINKIFSLRIDLKGEIDGLNKSEHGASTEIFDLYTTLHKQASTGDITLRAPVEPFTEVGQIAEMYNEVMDKLEENTVEKGEYLNILENVSDGMFLLSKDGSIGNYYSRSLDHIIEKEDLSDKNFVDIIDPLLPDTEREVIENFVDVIFDNTIQWRHVDRLNPLKTVESYFDDMEGGFNIKHLQFNFKRIEKDGEIVNILVMIRDNTEEVKLNKQIENDRKKSHVEMELLYKVLHVEPSLLKEFFRNSNEDLNDINNLFQGNQSIREKLESSYRICHGIKGDSELLELTFISEKAEELEKIMDKMLKSNSINSDDLIPLTIKFSELQSTFRSIEELLGRWAGFRTDAVNDFKDKNRYFKEHLVKMTGRLSERSNKNISIDLDGLILDSLVEEQFKPVQDILVQFIRNSISHGVDYGGVADITIKSVVLNDTIQVIYSDNGKGLDLNKIRQTAFDQGIISTEQFEKLSDQIIPRLIFQQGLSTADSGDILSGKGVGMPLVNKMMKQLGGGISILSKSGMGCQFTLKIPKVSEMEKVRA